MASPTPGFLDISTGSPSRSFPGSPIKAPTTNPFEVSPRANGDEVDDDEDEDEDEEDEAYVPRQASRRKQRHLSRPDAFGSISKSTKRRHTSKSLGFGYN